MVMMTYFQKFKPNQQHTKWKKLQYIFKLLRPKSGLDHVLILSQEKSHNMTEAVARRCSVEFFQEALAQVFSWEFCEIS